MIKQVKILTVIFLFSATVIAAPYNIEDTRILSIELPTTISKIESTYGQPINVELPHPQDLSPSGQWFRWEIKKKGVYLTALADDYSQVPNHNASVRVLKIKSIDPKKSVKAIYGYTINETKKSILQAEHKDTIQESARFTVKYYENKIWTYFSCNKNGIVNEIIQSTFNLDEAD